MSLYFVAARDHLLGGFWSVVPRHNPWHIVWCYWPESKLLLCAVTKSNGSHLSQLAAIWYQFFLKAWRCPLNSSWNKISKRSYRALQIWRGRNPPWLKFSIKWCSQARPSLWRSINEVAENGHPSPLLRQKQQGNPKVPTTNTPHNYTPPHKRLQNKRQSKIITRMRWDPLLLVFPCSLLSVSWPFNSLSLSLIFLIWDRSHLRPPLSSWIEW